MLYGAIKQKFPSRIFSLVDKKLIRASYYFAWCNNFAPCVIVMSFVCFPCETLRMCSAVLVPQNGFVTIPLLRTAHASITTDKTRQLAALD
jgi:hypothetical protein